MSAGRKGKGQASIYKYTNVCNSCHSTFVLYIFTKRTKSHIQLQNVKYIITSQINTHNNKLSWLTLNYIPSRMLKESYKQIQFAKTAMQERKLRHVIDQKIYTLGSEMKCKIDTLRSGWIKGNVRSEQ